MKKMTYRNLAGVIRKMYSPTGTSSPMNPTVQPDGKIEYPKDTDVPSQAPADRLCKDDIVSKIRNKKQQDQKKIIDNP
jgi:hypothetical protein